MRRVAKLINRYEWLFLLLIIPPLLFPNGGLSLFLLVVPLLWLVRRIATGRFFVPTPYDLAIFVLLLMVLVSLYAVFDIELSFRKIAGVVLGVALFYGTVAHAHDFRHGRYHVLAFLILSGTAMAVVGLFGSRWIGPFAPLSRFGALLPAALSNVPGAANGVVNANQLAGTMNWLVPLLLACTLGFAAPLWRAPGAWRKLLLLGLLGLLLFTTVILLGTLSRGGVLSLAAAVLVMLAIRYRWGRWLLLAAVIGGIASAFYFDVNTVLFGGGEAADALGLQGRMEIWSRALYGLADFPLTGMSMNGFREVVHILYPLFRHASDYDLGHAHNQLLQAGLDLGLPGLIAYLSLWLITAGLLWRGWRQAVDHADRVLLLGLAGSFTAAWTFGIMDAISLGARPGFLWWLLLGLLAAVFAQIHQPTPAAVARPTAVTQPA